MENRIKSGGGGTTIFGNTHTVKNSRFWSLVTAHLGMNGASYPPIAAELLGTQNLDLRVFEYKK